MLSGNKNPNNKTESATPALDLITEHDLATTLHVCLRTLARHHDARTGPPRIKIGRRHFYKISSVNEWLARREGYGDAQPVAMRRRNARRTTLKSR
jgi:hypothetical protein